MRLNEYMALDIYLGHMSPSEVALMSGDDMLTMEARKQSELTKTKAHEAKQLDWAQKMRPQILESIGLDQGLGDPCKKCRGKNTTYTQKQTRSAMQWKKKTWKKKSRAFSTSSASKIL